MFLTKFALECKGLENEHFAPFDFENNVKLLLLLLLRFRALSNQFSFEYKGKVKGKVNE